MEIILGENDKSSRRKSNDLMKPDITNARILHRLQIEIEQYSN